MSALHLHAWGPADGRPVLVVHGVTNTGARYRALAEERLPGLRVLAPDLRGHGHSTWDPPWNAEALVADLVDTLDAAGVDTATVVGHSYGGMLAVHLAATAPERVGAVVLLDPAVAIASDRAIDNAEEARLDEGWATTEEARAEREALRPVHSRHTVADDLLTHLVTSDDGRVRLRFSRPAAVTAWGEMARPVPSLAGFSGPLTLVVALQEDIVTDALRTALRRDLGDRFTEVGIDAGHMLHWDAPDEVAALILAASG